MKKFAEGSFITTAKFGNTVLTVDSVKEDKEGNVEKIYVSSSEITGVHAVDPKDAELVEEELTPSEPNDVSKEDEKASKEDKKNEGKKKHV